MNPPLLAAHGQRGFSLLEVLMTLVMLGTFLGSLLLVVSQGTMTARRGMACQSIEALGQRTVDRMARELVSAGAGTLTPNPAAPWGSDHLTFQRVEGYDVGVVQWEVANSFSLQMDEGELDDGQDNNGNGLSDERELVYTRDSTGAAEKTVLVHGVTEYLEGEHANGLDDNGNGLKDEAGLSFERVGAKLILRLSLAKNDIEGHTTTRTVQTTVHLRN